MAFRRSLVAKGLVTLGIVLTLSACASPTATPVPTPTPSATPEPTPTPTLTPTPTPLLPSTCGSGVDGFCQKLVAESQTVLIGRVVSPRPDLQRIMPKDDKNGIAFRDWDVEVERYVLSPQPYERIQVRTFVATVLGDGLPSPPLYEPQMTEGRRFLLFLNRPSRPYDDWEELKLGEGQFTIVTLPIKGPHGTEQAGGRLEIVDGKARAWVFTNEPRPWEPLEQIIATVKRLQR